MEESKKYEPKGEEEIRAEVAKEWGLDPENEDDLTAINKLVKKELDWQNE
jgi:hypothetical protein